MTSNLSMKLSEVAIVMNGRPIVKDINLSILRGEFVAIVGPSGCGKTTLLNLMSGHKKPDIGKVECFGSVRRVYQQGGLLPWLTVRGNIELGARSLATKERRAEVDRILDLISMRDHEKQYPHQLSGGMSQRVELARAICGSADILLLDEPFSAIDYLSRLKLRDELCRLLREQPKTVVLVTHEIEEAVQLADRIFVLSGHPGSIVSEEVVQIPKPRKPASHLLAEKTHQILGRMGLT